jgi:Polyketide cyclase / dehydrase and lipid transport
MAEASTSIDLSLPADQVWQLIGGFGSLPDWLPYIPNSELSEGGRVRHLANPDGDAIVERLIAFDNAARSYSYAILQAPFPVTDYQSTLKVVDKGGNACRVEWSGRFAPKGVSDQEASKLFQGIYEEGLKALTEELAKVS